MNQHDDDDKRVIHLFDVPHLDTLHITAPLLTADHVAVMRCNDRSHVHLVLFDANDVPIAQCTAGHPLIEMINCESKKVLGVVQQ